MIVLNISYWNQSSLLSSYSGAPGGLTPGQLQELQEQADAALPALQAWAPLQRFRWRAVIWSAASFAVHQGNLRSSLEGI